MLEGSTALAIAHLTISSTGYGVQQDLSAVLHST